MPDLNEMSPVPGAGQGVQMSSVGAMPTTQVKYAGFWIRFVAIMVDGLVLDLPIGLAQFALRSAFPSVALSQWTAFIVGYLAYLSITWIYFTWMTYAVGATLGKMLVGIRVKSDDFQRLSFGRVLLRETVGKFVSGIILCIGYIIAGVTQRKQALHDKFAHSVVVYKDPANPSKAGLIVGIAIAAILPALAIMGILSSVVLVALNTARQKGYDAQTVAGMNEIQLDAELYYSANNSYSRTQSCAGGMFLGQGMQKIIAGLPNGHVECYAEGSSYAVSANLSTSISSYCVDSSGYSGNGTASDDGTKASCLPQQAATEKIGGTVTGQSIPSVSIPANNGPQTASTDTYSYTLPSGWVVAQNGPQGMQALNQGSGYLLSIVATAIPSLYGNVASVDQVTSVDQLKSSLVKKYTSANIMSVETGTLGGKKAYILNYSVSAADLTGTQNQGQPKEVAITEYTTVDSGSVYTLVFVSNLPDQAVAQNDLRTIVSSFKFRQL